MAAMISLALLIFLSPFHSACGISSFFHRRRTRTRVKRVNPLIISFLEIIPFK
jgi:hypothetical protein